jgi:hypothetical protein
MEMPGQATRARAASKPPVLSAGGAVATAAKEPQRLDLAQAYPRGHSASVATNPVAAQLAGGKGAERARVAQVRQLQRMHGNRVVARWIHEACATEAVPNGTANTVQQGGAGAVASRQSPSIQRQAAPAETPLIDRYRTALRAEDWAQAAVLLNGFNDADIEARVNDATELPPPSRLQLRLHTPDWAFRVRRPLLLLDYNDAKAAGRWADAAKWLNGFNDADIQLLASQLTATEVGPMVHGAREAMQGASLNRVLQGIAKRYDKVSPDPLGTKALTVVGLMQAAGAPVSAASTYLQLKLGVAVAPGPAGAGSAGGLKTPADHMADVNVFSAAMKSGGALATAGGAGKPKALPPAQLEQGNLAHELIGDTYCALNPPSVSDWSVFDVLGLAKGRVPKLAKGITAAQADLFVNFDMRPDIADLGKMQIFEIKRIGSTALAVFEASLYIKLFDSLGIRELHFSLGNPGNRGTRGIIPGPQETLVWASPLPGAIVYAFVRPPESPRRMQERIESGATEPGLNLGPEAITGLGLAGAVAAGVALPEVSAAAVGTYEVLMPILTAAARAAGQEIPHLITP